MTTKVVLNTLALVGLLIVLPARQVEAQETSSGTAWKVPRTPDGKPNLQGTWTNSTLTPLERPVRFGGRAVLTNQEAAELEAQAVSRFNEQTADREVATAPPRQGGAVGSYNNSVWSDSRQRVAMRQTSLVVDPPDGRVPVRPEAERVRESNNARSSDSYEFFNVFDRCITRGVPGGFFPAPYNNGYQIFQTPGYVVILSEMIHEARIVPTDGRPHRAAHLKSINGESVGRWEGDTLVVDTTNYNDKGSIATASTSGRMRGVPQSEALHVVERFTPFDADTIVYTVTIDDPNVYTRPWTVSMPLNRDNTHTIYEYACHEANYGIVNILRAARMEDSAKSGTR